MPRMPALLRPGRIFPHFKGVFMNIIDIITKKKNHLELSYDELAYAFKGYLERLIPDYQMSALLMAITINGMSYQETMNLTDIFINSGEVYTFNKRVCDKHSTGGIGDTVTFIIAPIVAALGVPIAKMSGKGLGITGGTIDKLESIPGFNVNLSKDDYIKGINSVGIAIGAQTDNLVPMDKVIYALRDVTGTTESIPLIASSIMSKKIACGATYIVIDIKCGEGALIKNKEDAEKLSEWLIKIGEHFNRKVKTIITDMDEPLSSAIGNALEVEEAINVLKGKRCKLRDTAVLVASNILSMAKEISVDDASKLANSAIDKGLALEFFYKWIKLQGGRINELKISDKVIELKAKQDGYIKKISALACGKLALKLGAGRLNKQSKIDYSVGIKLLHDTGDYVHLGDVLALIYVNDYNILIEDNIFTIEYD